MEQDDELWPPFGPAAEFRQAAEHGAARARHQHIREERAREVRELHDRGQPDRPRGARAPARPRPVQPQARGRDRRGPALSRAEIVAAAIAEADQFGAEAVSMRRIAQVLRAGAMSLYWHLASKEHLLELMLDAVIAEVDVPDASGDWRRDLRVQAVSTREVMLRHKWFVDFITVRPSLGPNTLRNLDKSFASLDGLGLDTVTALNVLQTVNTYVLGAVVREFQELRVQREQEKLSGLDATELHAQLEQWRDRLAQTGRFDHFLRIFADDIDPDAEETRTERFEFGLDCVLDGIAARLSRLSN